MRTPTFRRALAGSLLGAVLVVTSPGAGIAAVTDAKPGAGTRFYVPPPNPGATQQLQELKAAGDRQNAMRLSRMLGTSQAVWFEAGTPGEVRAEVRSTMDDAARQKAVPVLVVYNIPFRDCAQFSAGGATNPEEYLAWIDGFASGIGSGRAIVILEPDGLGIIPFYTPIGSSTMEWCQPPEADPATAAADRFFMLNEAVDRLGELANVDVYLDGTHSAWLSVGDVAHRLDQAGVQRAQGFFVNVSNYRLTEHLDKYGTWISKCLAFANNPEEGGWRLGHYDWCASQYFPADPNDFSTWHLSDEWYDANLGTAVPTAHFVVDTSRNGQGPWTPPAGVYPDPQDWCNPPGRGLGPRPTVDTGNTLVDAYVWVKTPGESDGECTRGLGPAGTTVDPEWGIVDPDAGDWFPQQALQLVQLANPPL
jgi:endoglucanase